MPARFTLAAEPVTDSDSVRLLREFSGEMASRYSGEPATEAVVDSVLAAFPNDDLVPPHGAFLVLRTDSLVLRTGTGRGQAIGCAGIRPAGPGTGELTRLYVRTTHRGLGLGARLLHGAENAARDLGLTRLHLDTRSDLVEARALYANHGWREVPPPPNPGPYQDHFFTKPL